MSAWTARKRWAAATAVAATVTLLAAGCSGSDEPSNDDNATVAGGTSDRELVIWAGSQTPITPNFNPYSPTVLHLANGGIYETLFAYNKLQDVPATPMLGTDFSWNDEGTELDVTIRDGVKWNDGEDFTADDVVFSFTNDTAKPDFLKNATADGDTVKFTFDEPAFANEFQILGSTYIVPEHVFSKQADLTTWTNADAPVGTGPYLLDTASDAAYTAKANPEFWGGEPQVAKLRYLGIDANQSAEDLLRSGQIDWTTMFVPEPDALVDGTNGTLGYLNTPIDPTVLYTCSNAELGCEGAQTDVAVRQALSAAIGRGEIND
jgi:peptide/nickel transport system substrate-binding protein